MSSNPSLLLVVVKCRLCELLTGCSSQERPGTPLVPAARVRQEAETAVRQASSWPMVLPGWVKGRLRVLAQPHPQPATPFAFSCIWSRTSPESLWTQSGDRRTLRGKDATSDPGHVPPGGGICKSRKRGCSQQVARPCPAWPGAQGLQSQARSAVVTSSYPLTPSSAVCAL